MKTSLKDKLNIVLIAVVLFGLFLFGIFKPDTKVSLSERRMLKTRPEVSIESVFSNKGGTTFMDEFETYASDQFPLRESFRTINSCFERYALLKNEVNGIVYKDGHLSKVDGVLSEADLNWSASRISFILGKYEGIKDAYLSVIPDKNNYLAAGTTIPYVAVEDVEEYIKAELNEKDLTFIDISGVLTIDDYYKTDTHWRQERLEGAKDKLLETMGSACESCYESNTLPVDYKGVYYGQAALPVPAEKISYLTWDEMEDLIVTCYDSGKPELISIYDFDKTYRMDPYEFFLSGSKALITIENPDAANGELIIFRDSYASSLAPLLAGSYKKITLVDIRYISPSLLDRFVDFDGADVLFLYSQALLNSSIGQFLK